MNNQLVDYLSESKLLSKCQFGFCGRKSTELGVTFLCGHIRKNADSKLLTGCVFADFSRAFDTISHAKLLQKSNACGIKHFELEWFLDYLFNCKQLVSYNNTLPESGLRTCGAPRGSILGPLLFIIFANDIVDVLRNSGIIKYANDTELYVAGKSIEIIKSQLSDDLNLLAKWFKENELILKGKTEAMIFGAAKCLAMLNRALKVKYQHHTVNISTSYRYFGVDIDSSLTFNNYFMILYKKATGCLHLLNKLRFQLDMKAAVTIYRSSIIPVLTYCSLLSIFDKNLRADRLKSIDSRVTRIVNRHVDQAHTVSLPSITLIKKKHACLFVCKYIDGKFRENFAEFPVC